MIMKLFSNAHLDTLKNNYKKHINSAYCNVMWSSDELYKLKSIELADFIKKPIWNNHPSLKNHNIKTEEVEIITKHILSSGCKTFISIGCVDASKEIQLALMFPDVLSHV